MYIDRRAFLRVGAGLLGLPMLHTVAASGAQKIRGHVVVVGGGYAGATTASYLRQWSDYNLNVTLVEPNSGFVSCPFSNLVIGGLKGIGDISFSYGGLKKMGVRVVRDSVIALEHDKRQVRLVGGDRLSYDRVVLAPGIDLMFDTVEGYDSKAQELIMHAWKAGPQTVKLRAQLESMPDGGVFAICIPRAPYRCPPAPYERACLVADYFKRHKPKSKVIVLDANAEIQSKARLFSKAWKELYPGMVEYHPDSELLELDAKNKTAVLDFDQLKADVLNAVPQQRAGTIARESGLKLINDRWVEMNWLTMESVNVPGVHVLGDALFPSPRLPKSGHSANQLGKVTAAAILNLLAGVEPNAQAMLINTCYSFMSGESAAHISSVHKYDSTTGRYVKTAGGLSPARNWLEVKIAHAWAKNIWSDTLAI